MSALLPLLLLIPLWFLLVRPQRQRIRAQQTMVRSLAVGDDVLTSAGIYGSIVDLGDEVATLEVADGVHLRIARMAIGRRLNTRADELPPDELYAGEPPASPSASGESDRTLLPPAPEEP